jgi:hypothetical protein
MVVAQIAYNHLDPEVKTRCDALIAVNLGTFSTEASSNFVTAAVWADEIKSFTSAYNTWHYIDIPFSLDGYPTNGFHLPAFDVVQAIRQCITTLQNPAAADTNQATALRFLIHFVGDIQQPLHCSTAISTNWHTGDLGGNNFSLTPPPWNNLHSLWDAGGGYLVDSVYPPLDSNEASIITNKAAAVEAAYPYTKTIGSIADPMNWAVEGWGLAQTVSYVGITTNSTPSAAYTNTAQATTKQRMAVGGQRLAKLLNTIFVTNAPAVVSATFTNGSFGFSWSSVSGRTYRVQWKQELSAPAWNDLTDITASTNSTSFTDPIAQQQRFYRAIVVN